VSLTLAAWILADEGHESGLAGQLNAPDILRFGHVLKLSAWAGAGKLQRRRGLSA